ncbi:hypothetical protein QEH59_05750 [Coraliomargarita sp. SDUM461004]|uniref:Beta-mannosidase B n=1 Tax=Thalassobacterium sedimentorum TaxID=3041258 RepID=A0ABU1AGK3_9BACT|nr:glycoside hydrolase family 2 protein [Coraliomargarita sp. SDUM461004]MDQ8193918.1 hypothetical protein [Coraliomargarita sp. SDUM461004]
MIARFKINTRWTFGRCDESTRYPAVVPGCVHTDLHREGLIPDPFYGRNEAQLQWIEECDWEYATRFDVTEQILTAGCVDLVADGLDTLATVILNGQVIAETSNMFLGLRYEVGSLLKPTGNELQIRFSNPMDYIREREGKPLSPIACDPIGGRQQIRKQQCAFGWDWGPRFATSGIWREIRLEAWSACRIEDYKLEQSHQEDEVVVRVIPELVGEFSEGTIVGRLCYEGETVVEVSSDDCQPLEFRVMDPHLWWPNGQGVQSIYTLELRLMAGDQVLDQRVQALGLCEIVLDRHQDEWGESFQFKVNGRAIFAKGANWIPSHCFVNEGETLAIDALDSARDANMNMIRVWGGGVYESDAFFQRCLENGLLVWHDFMFACWTYPGDPDYLDSVREEAIYQVRRLRNQSHLALWCGNNEIVQMHWEKMRDHPEEAQAYVRLFHEILPEVIAAHGTAASYWPSSGWNPQDPMGFTDNVDSGDTHFWGVWAARQPVEAYEALEHRFFSEFGMQAYPWPETAATFTKSRNIFSPDMNCHQKNGSGNEIIFHYISTLYRFPKDYESTVYLSQLNQAYCLRFGIEHMRRNMPRTMGALYWQLNDCWPVASWSSLDFGGRWKVLQYAARRFFAPALISVKRVGEETVIWSNNYRVSNIDAMEVHLVYDGAESAVGEVTWELWSFSQNQCLQSEQGRADLLPGTSQHYATVDCVDSIKRYERDDLVLRTRLRVPGLEDSCNTTFFSAPRHIDFKQPEINHSVRVLEDGSFEVILRSNVIAYQVFLKLADSVDFRASDNAFDLFPGEEVAICMKPVVPLDRVDFERLLQIFSYRDTYEN